MINGHKIPEVFTRHIGKFDDINVSIDGISDAEIINEFLENDGLFYLDKPNNDIMKYTGIDCYLVDRTLPYDDILKMKKEKGVSSIKCKRITELPRDFNELKYVKFAPCIKGKDINELITHTDAYYCRCISDFRIVETWDVSEMEDFSGMFARLDKPIGDITGWDMITCRNAENMFYNFTEFNQDISGWNMPRCENASNMFYNCHLLDADLSDWILPINCTGMFENCHMVSLAQRNMFKGCHLNNNYI